MVFVACGLNHHSAPIELREKIAVDTATQEKLLHSLMTHSSVNEAALLSTCNRTEIYCSTQEPDFLLPWLAKEHNLSKDALSPSFYLHQGPQGIKHILRVSSGLDSMMLGEPQILGQMKQAYHQAYRLGTIKSELRSVFEYVFSASKRIRTQSGIGNNPISVAYAAVQLLTQSLKTKGPLTVFLIGSGETTSLVAKYLKEKAQHQFLVASRTHENAQKLANSLGGKALSITDIPNYLAHADAVISATACPLPFINKSLVEHALSQRNQKPMFFLDLAVPRDIEQDVSELEHATLYNIDDLNHLIQKGMDERRSAASQAEQLIESELTQYTYWRRSLQAKNTICAYRKQMSQLAQNELKKAQNKIYAGHDVYQTMNEFSTRLVNKLTHYPSTGLRQIAWDNREDLLALVDYLLKSTNTDQLTYEEIS